MSKLYKHNVFFKFYGLKYPIKFILLIILSKHLALGCGQQYPARLPGKMSLHIKRAHSQLKCDRPRCKFVS